MLNSYIEFTAFGVYCNEFIDYLISSDLEVSQITSHSGIFTIRATPNSYLQIARKAREFRVKTKVVTRAGIYFTIRRYRRRIGIPAGLLAFFSIIVLMSGFVWSVRVVGLCESSAVSRWQILEHLSTSGIRPGVRIDSFDANLAELELSLAFDEIAWVSIERAGSRINVKINERLSDSDTDRIPVSQPCNIIASHSGQLIRAEIYRGELLYEVGSGINAGDVVVTGIINDGGGRIAQVHADAQLIVEVVEVIDFYQPYTVFHRAKSGHNVSNQSIVFLGRRFGGELDINPHADHIEYREFMTAPDLFGFPLPIRVLNQDYVFYDRIEVTDPPVTALNKLNRAVELYELNFLGTAEIISKETEYFPDDNGISVTVRYVFHVDAAVKQEIGVDNKR
jgi:similar to stage IV sporulation protein